MEVSDDPPTGKFNGILLVGEAPGAHEEREGKPFVGPSGQELNHILSDAGIRRSECYLTNVFTERPPRNDVEAFFGPRSGPVDHSFPPIRKGKYLLRVHTHHLLRLCEVVQKCQPRLILAAGNSACWALLQKSGIGSMRGFISPANIGKGTFACLPIYHPAAILRMWPLRAVTVLDCQKGLRYLQDAAHLLHRRINVCESVRDIGEFAYKLIKNIKDPLSFDVETKQGQITMISFSEHPEESFVIPFTTNEGQSVWDAEVECYAWSMVAKILGSDRPKVAQNGLYDIQYLWRAHGIPVNNYEDDTMLMHHSLQPELPKRLGFLASVYTDAPLWKDLRKGEELKRDE